MVEVFRTDVVDLAIAQKLLELIHLNCQHYLANFDLQDCDHILRVQTDQDHICAQTIIEILRLNGFHAEILIG